MELEKRILSVPLYSTDGKKEKKVLVTFSVPGTYWRWYVCEGSREDDDIILFGYVRSGLAAEFSEWGYASLKELCSVGVVGFIDDKLWIMNDGSLFKK